MHFYYISKAFLVEFLRHIQGIISFYIDIRFHILVCSEVHEYNFIHIFLIKKISFFYYVYGYKKLNFVHVCKVEKDTI